MSSPFKADPAFDAGSVIAADWPLCQVRLQDDGPVRFRYGPGGTFRGPSRPGVRGDQPVRRVAHRRHLGGEHERRAADDLRRELVAARVEHAQPLSRGDFD